jgi:hypothetical protein
MSRQSVYKRVRHAVDKRKNKIILDYMKENWDVVLNSSVTMMKGLPFFTRFRFAVDIILGKRKNATRAIREPRSEHDERPGFKDISNMPEKPKVTPPPQKPAENSDQSEK